MFRIYILNHVLRLSGNIQSDCPVRRQNSYFHKMKIWLKLNSDFR
jgi:hypothetical protein